MKFKFTLLAIIVSSLLIMAFSGNPPNGNTNAPGDSVCTSCHNPPSSTSLDGSLEITGLPNTITAGSSYILTVTTANPSLNANRAGFQMVALDESDSNAGTLSNPGASSNLNTAGGRTYFEHAPAQSFGGNSAVSWTVDWQAPAPGELMDGDSIFLYGASMIANGSGSNSDILRLDELRVEINNPAEPLMLSVSNIIPTLCNGSSDGQAMATASEGAPPYNIEWDNGEGGNQATMLSVGMHTVTVTDSNDDTATASFEMQEPTPISIIINPGNDYICYNTCTGSINYEAMGGAGNYSYDWSGPNGFSSSQQYLADLCKGMYNLTITDQNSCTFTTVTEILEFSEITIPVVELDHVSCFGNKDGRIVIDPSGGSGSLDATWSNGAIGDILQDVPAGLYTVTITDEAGCTATSFFEIQEPQEITLVIEEVTSIECSQELGSLLATTNASNPTFMWSNGVTTAANNDIPAGTYLLTVVDDNNCMQVVQYDLTEPSAVTISFDVSPIDQGNDGTIEANPQGGVPPYQFQWNTGSTDSILVDLDEGTYIVTITDAVGCIVIDSTSLTQDEMSCDFELIVTQTLENCEGEFNYSVTLDSLALNGANFDWSSNQDTALTTNSYTTGDYSVIGYDDNGCLDTLYFTVDSIINVTIDETLQTDITCSDSLGMITVIVVDDNGPYDYQWSNGDTTNTADSLDAGVITVTITNNTGCSETFDFTIVDYSIILLDTIGAEQACDYFVLDTITGMNLTGLEEYQSVDGSVYAAGDTIFQTDTMLVMSPNGICDDTISFIVTIYPSPMIDQIPNTVVCDFYVLDSITGTDLTGDEYYTDYFVDTIYEVGDTIWTSDTLKVVSSNHGCSDEMTFVVQISNKPVIDLVDIEVFLDEDGIFEDLEALEAAVVTLSGACYDSLYLEYDPTLFTCGNIGLNTVYTTIYSEGTVVGIDSFVATVLDTIPPEVMCPDTIFDAGVIFCGEGATILQEFVVPGSSIIDNCTIFDDVTLTATLFVTETGFYDFQFVIVDEYGNADTCTLVRYFEVHPQPAVEFIVTDALCFGASDGCIEAVVTGGTPPFVMTEDICDIPAGTYYVEVVDQNGCTDGQDVIVNQPTEIIITIDDTSGETPGESDGFINISVVGGSGSYSFSWTENGIEVSTLEDLTNFPSSQYVLTVTDANGCEATLNTFIDVFNSNDDPAFSNLLIYPNPFTNTIKIDGLEDMDVDIVLYDIVGKRLAITMDKHNGQCIIQAEELVDGVYFISISDGYHTSNHKLIKSK